MTLNAETFFISFTDELRKSIEQLHQTLLKHDFQCDVKETKSGLLISYASLVNKHTIASFVKRKTGWKIRLYLDHIKHYDQILDDLSIKVKKEITKASVCKRLIDPDQCNPKCKKGYTFHMDEIMYQKCRYMSFMLTINQESIADIQQLLNHELSSN